MNSRGFCQNWNLTSTSCLLGRPSQMPQLGDPILQQGLLTTSHPDQPSPLSASPLVRWLQLSWGFLFSLSSLAFMFPIVILLFRPEHCPHSSLSHSLSPLSPNLLEQLLQKPLRLFKNNNRGGIKEAKLQK